MNKISQLCLYISRVLPLFIVTKIILNYIFLTYNYFLMVYNCIFPAVYIITWNYHLSKTTSQQPPCCPRLQVLLLFFFFSMFAFIMNKTCGSTRSQPAVSKVNQHQRRRRSSVTFHFALTETCADEQIDGWMDKWSRSLLVSWDTGLWRLFPPDAPFSFR